MLRIEVITANMDIPKEHIQDKIASNMELKAVYVIELIRNGVKVQPDGVLTVRIKLTDAQMFCTDLRVFEEDSIIHSKTFSMLASCLNFLEATKAHIDTTEIYMSLEKIGGDNYKKWGIDPEESIEEEPVSENITERAKTWCFLQKALSRWIRINFIFNLQAIYLCIKKR